MNFIEEICYFIEYFYLAAPNLVQPRSNEYLAMNAKKYQPILRNSVKTEGLMDSPLKFLSPFQKQKSAALAKDWRSFTHGLFGDILNNF